MDALITDPPYSSGGAFRGDRAKPPSEKYEQGDAGREDFAGDAKDQRAWTNWVAEWLRECRRVVKPGGVFAIFTDWRQLPSLTDAVQWSDWVWRGVAVWDKGEGSRCPVPGRFRHQCEYVVWGSSGPLAPGSGMLPGCLREGVRQSDKHHMTGKPTAVMRWLARFAPAGGVVLDPFAGSGTTGVGALLEGRGFVGYERTEHYYEVARRRLTELRG